MANWLKITRRFGELLFTIKNEMSMKDYSFLKKNSHHSLTIWNSQGTHSNATCKSCYSFRNLKEVTLSTFHWQNSVTQQMFRTNLYNLITGEEHILSYNEMRRFFSALFLWLQIWISFALSRESSYEYLNNTTLSAAAIRACGTVQGLEAKDMGTLT